MLCLAKTLVTMFTFIGLFPCVNSFVCQQMTYLPESSITLHVYNHKASQFFCVLAKACCLKTLPTLFSFERLLPCVNSFMYLQSAQRSQNTCHTVCLPKASPLCDFFHVPVKCVIPKNTCHTVPFEWPCVNSFMYPQSAQFPVWAFSRVHSFLACLKHSVHCLHSKGFCCKVALPSVLCLDILLLCCFSSSVSVGYLNTKRYRKGQRATSKLTS